MRMGLLNLKTTKHLCLPRCTDLHYGNLDFYSDIRILGLSSVICKAFPGLPLYRWGNWELKKRGYYGQSWSFRKSDLFPPHILTNLVRQKQGSVLYSLIQHLFDEYQYNPSDIESTASGSGEWCYKLPCFLSCMVSCPRGLWLVMLVDFRTSAEERPRQQCQEVPQETHSGGSSNQFHSLWPLPSTPLYASCPTQGFS